MRGKEGQPFIVLAEGTDRSQGQNAQSNNIQAARAISDAVRSTLGPRGMDKMLVDSMGDVVITNDGVTILNEIDIQHPAAKMMVEVAKSLEQEVGDGTTSSVVLAGELLNKSEDLLNDVHATLITRGFNLAAERAQEILDNLTTDVDVDDDELLAKVARTSMASKLSGGHLDTLAPVTVEAIRAVSRQRDGNVVVEKDDIGFSKKTGGSVEDTEVIDGLLLDKDRVHSGMPETVEDANILLLNKAIEFEKTEVDSEIQISDPDQLQAFLDQEQDVLEEMVDQIEASGANVVFCQKGIDDVAQHLLARRGIFAVRRAKKSDMQRLEKATGARIVNSLDDLTEDDLGTAGRVEERTIGDDTSTFVTGAPDAEAVSVLIRGGTEHVVDEVERTLEDSIGSVAAALEEGKVVPGAGATETEVALRLREYANTVGGREQLAIETFADAIEIVPRTLAENAGMDAIQVLVDLRSEHENGNKSTGVLVDEGEIRDATAEGAVEPLRVKTQTIKSAAEAATMVLRIDDVIASKGAFDEDAGGPPAGGPGGPGGGPPGGGMPGGMPGGMGGLPGM
ncbi:thermosome subunit [Thermoplasmatales archaeon SW_10_69_26]|jgi:thermosome|nr:MAG: thermosome subunit [Thermoplasmatales archaeon SW_10_69_26]